MALQKVGPYVIDPKEPWKNDKLDRKKVADYLTPVIASVTQPFTISLHSPYGTGKTSFIQSWQADLRSQGYKTVYFNAWETDFSQDAFLAFMAAVREQLSEQSSAPARVGDKLTDIAKRGVWTLTRRIVPAIAKGAVKKVLGDEAFEDVSDAIALDGDKVSDAAGELVAAGLEAQLAAEKSREEFKVELSKTVSALFPDEVDVGKRKVVVFVDDLDRCRPTYAIAVLEAIKHLFEIDGLLFVLSIDEFQIQESVRSVYGAGANADGYLAKFIDWRYQLPKLRQDTYVEFVLDKFLVEKSREYGSSELESYKSMLDALKGGARAFGWSLRECNSVIANVNLVCRAVKTESVFFARVIGLTAVLSHQFKKDFEGAVRDGNEEAIFQKIQQFPNAVALLQIEPWVRLRDELDLIFTKIDQDFLDKRIRAFNETLQSDDDRNIVDRQRRVRAARTRALYEIVERALSGRIFNLNIPKSLASFAYSDLSGAAQVTGVAIPVPPDQA